MEIIGRGRRREQVDRDVSEAVDELPPRGTQATHSISWATCESLPVPPQGPPHLVTYHRAVLRGS